MCQLVRYMENNNFQFYRNIKTFGVIFLILEILKQIYLFFVVWEGEYNVWYFPFQLCSMPIYMCRMVGDNKSDLSFQGITDALIGFLRDYCFLGGLMALIVREGFTFSDYPLLTAHGWIWHILMIALAVYLFMFNQKDISFKGFLRETIVFLICSAIAMGLNIALKEKGDCDMFYISPYHLSSQPVFSGIDAIIGRSLGIMVYLMSVVLGAFIVNRVFYVIKEKLLKKTC